jgi:class 3 adenylate cyclase
VAVFGISEKLARTSARRLAASVQQARTSARDVPDGAVTIMFSDIEHSTELTERLGDRAWQELLREHNALIREQLQKHDGYEVKTMGDGFMVAFESARKGIECAVAIQRAFAARDAANGERVKVRLGLHAGEAIREGDDFYGKNVILASRVAGQAKGGEIIVSSPLRQSVEGGMDASLFGEPRDLQLKGLSGTQRVFAVEWRD